MSHVVAVAIVVAVDVAVVRQFLCRVSGRHWEPEPEDCSRCLSNRRPSHVDLFEHPHRQDQRLYLRDPPQDRQGERAS